MKRCDVCGNAKANFGIGATMVCRGCEPALKEKIEELRAQGIRVNGMKRIGWITALTTSKEDNQ